MCQAIRYTAFIVLLCFPNLSSANFNQAFAQFGPLHTKTFLTRPVQVSGYVPSMSGPSVLDELRLEPKIGRQLIWLVGYDVELTNVDGNRLNNQEFLCHSHVRFAKPSQWRSRNIVLFSGSRPGYSKWFTLVPGQSSIRLPSGFGIPLLNDVRIRIFNMALNLNPKIKQQHLRFRVRIHYLRHSELRHRLVALGKSGYAIEYPASKNVNHLSGCGLDSNHLVVESTNASRDQIDGYQLHHNPALLNNRPMHFLVPPGKHVYRTRFRSFAPYNTTLHYLSGHLHLYGQKIELWNLSQNKLLVTLNAKHNATKTYLEQMTYLSDPRGISMSKDHNYELRAFYDNTTSQPIDAMAVVYAYYAIDHFRPSPLGYQNWLARGLHELKFAAFRLFPRIVKKFYR